MYLLSYLHSLFLLDFIGYETKGLLGDFSSSSSSSDDLMQIKWYQLLFQYDLYHLWYDHCLLIQYIDLSCRFLW